MARSRKTEDKPKDSGSLQISVEDFVRTRNSVSYKSLISFSIALIAKVTWYAIHNTTLCLPPRQIPPPPTLPPIPCTYSFVHVVVSVLMSPSPPYMTCDQRVEALEAVHLLTRPIENVCGIAYKLVRNVMYGAVHPEQSQLIVTPQVVTGLATLQSAVSDLSRAYIAHTDTVIGRGNASSLEQLNISNPLSGENVLFGQRGLTPAPTVEAPPESKKRKRAPHDKNAPKRALTPFFLYLQGSRAALTAELGPGKTAKEVQDEGGRRWREMNDEDKKPWQEKYQVNFARYRAQMDSYKAGQGIPVISDEEAQQIYDHTKKAGKLPTPPEFDPGHVEDEEDSNEDSDDESEEKSPEPIKAPPPKRSKAVKDATEKKAAGKTPVLKESESAAIETSSRSPEKKRKGSKKRDSKAAEERVESDDDATGEPASPPPKAASPEKPKKSKGKKRKGEA